MHHDPTGVRLRTPAAPLSGSNPVLGHVTQTRPRAAATLVAMSEWSAVLSAMGLVTVYLTGRRFCAAWVFGLMTQGVWLVYSIDTRQLPFLLSVLCYTGIYVRNLVKWRREGLPWFSSVREGETEPLAADRVDGHDPAVTARDDRHARVPVPNREAP